MAEEINEKNFFKQYKDKTDDYFRLDKNDKNMSIYLNFLTKRLQLISKIILHDLQKSGKGFRLKYHKF